MDEYQEVFLEEAVELLAELEDVLLELEERPADLELLAQTVRVLHTLTESATMFGFAEVGAFSQEVETVFERVHGGDLPASRAVLELGLGSRSHVRALLDGDADPAVADRLLEPFRVSGPAVDALPPAAESVPGSDRDAAEAPAPGAAESVLGNVLTIWTAKDVRARLLDLLEAGAPLELDLGSVTEADLTALQLLCAAHRSARERDLEFRVTRASPCLEALAARAGLRHQGSEPWLWAPPA